MSAVLRKVLTIGWRRNGRGELGAEALRSLGDKHVRGDENCNNADTHEAEAWTGALIPPFWLRCKLLYKTWIFICLHRFVFTNL
jgi:hypothetical protein